MQTVENLLRQHIAENILFSVNGYPYPDDASFMENYILDSMNVMELVQFVEETLGIKIEDNEVVPENFDSISCMAEFIRRKQSHSTLSLVE
jgi:acyl carrier protein